MHKHGAILVGEIGHQAVGGAGKGDVPARGIHGKNRRGAGAGRGLRRQRRLADGNQLDGIGGKIAQKHVKSVVVVVRHEASAREIISLVVDVRRGVFPGAVKGRITSVRRQADGIQEVLGETGAIRVRIQQGGGAGLEIAEIQVKIAGHDVGGQSGGAAEKGDKPSAGVNGRPVADRVRRHRVIGVATHQGRRRCLTVPEINVGIRVRIGDKNNEPPVRGHVQIPVMS